jgi:nucleoid-associated protein YgaU
MAKTKAKSKTQAKQKPDLKDTLKSFRLKQDTINTFVGLVAVIVFGFIGLNYFTNRQQENATPPVGNEETKSEVKTHTVAEGDDLWKIAEKYYGDGFKWEEIARANNITDPNLIEKGQTLSLPDITDSAVLADASVSAIVTPTISQSVTVTPEPTNTPTATATPSPQITKVAVSDTVPDDRIHTVSKGEGLWQIAEKYFGSGYNWVDIAKENSIKSPYVITTDQKVVIPEVDAKTKTTKDTAATDAISGDSYKVKSGDSLWTISVRAYGDGYKWTDVAKANNISNPSLITPDQELKLPR